jgi:hypothetical protein
MGDKGKNQKISLGNLGYHLNMAIMNDLCRPEYSITAFKVYYVFIIYLWSLVGFARKNQFSVLVVYVDVVCVDFIE